MSWSDRRHILVLLAASVAVPSGCFRPMLAEGEPAAAVRGRIALPKMDDRLGYFLTQSLESRLGEADQPEYRLEVNTTLRERNLAIAQDRSATRKTLIARTSWSLWRIGGAAPVMSDRIQVQSGYNATTSLFATRQAQLDIERRLARDIGERIARAVLARADRLGS